MHDPLLTVEDLQTHFFTEDGVVRAVDGISFDVAPGEIVGLVGESGAGKSVAVRSILRLVEDPGRIVGGEVRFRDQTLVGFEDDATAADTAGDDRSDDPGDEPGSQPGRPVPRPEMLSESAMRQRIRGNEIAIIFQDPMESLNPVYTVGGQLREFIELNRDLSGRAAREAAVEMLREVNIPDAERRYEDHPHEFSGGMRQRVLIAMALACEPSLIIADEPTTALDVTVEGAILDLVRDLQERYGTSFVWVTHDMGVVAEICDRVNVMYLGEIVEQAGVDELFHDTKHPYTQALLNSIPRPDETVEQLDPIAGVMPEAIDPPAGCRFHTRCPDAREVCTRRNPPCRTVVADGRPHRAACLKHESAFPEADYWASRPIGNLERPAPDARGDGDE